MHSVNIRVCVLCCCWGQPRHMYFKCVLFWCAGFAKLHGPFTQSESRTFYRNLAPLAPLSHHPIPPGPPHHHHTRTQFTCREYSAQAYTNPAPLPIIPYYVTRIRSNCRTCACMYVGLGQQVSHRLVGRILETYFLNCFICLLQLAPKDTVQETSSDAPTCKSGQPRHGTLV